nr:uncharacterized protein LOC128691049 [Cherax quadricarinatus]
MEKKHLLFTVLSFVAVNTLKSAQGVVRNTTSGCEVTVDLTDGQTPAVKHTTLGGSPQIALVLNVDGVSNPEEIKLKTKVVSTLWIWCYSTRLDTAAVFSCLVLKDGSTEGTV